MSYLNFKAVSALPKSFIWFFGAPYVYISGYYGEDWVPKIQVPKGNTRTRIKFWVWVELGLCLNSVGIFGLGTLKVQNFGFLWVLPLVPMRIGYPKFGHPRVIPEPESNFGYGLGWVCVWNPWVFSGRVPIKFKILGFFGYYPWVPMRIGYPKFGHPRVIPKQYYYKKCSYIQRYKYY